MRDSEHHRQVVDLQTSAIEMETEIEKNNKITEKTKKKYK